MLNKYILYHIMKHIFENLNICQLGCIIQYTQRIENPAYRNNINIYHLYAMLQW